MKEILKNIHQLLEIGKLFSGVMVINSSRNNFLDEYASVSDVIIFTGIYKNARFIQGAHPHALFIYNGAGINPTVVSKSADIEFAAKKIIEMRIFNSGQDCAGSNAILVDKAICSKLLKNLSSYLTKIKIGDYHNREVQIGKLGDYRQIPIISTFLDKHHKDIIYGGLINFKDYIVFPVIVASAFKSGIGYQEFFAPVFHVISYNNNNELKQYFNNKKYKDHAMHISLFGDSEYIEKIQHSQILQNKIVNDVEQGNYPYGGHGNKVSFASYAGNYFNRPILISKEIAEYLKNK